MEEIMTWFEDFVFFNPVIRQRLLATGIAILLFWLFHKLIKYLINRNIGDLKVKYHWRKTSYYVILIVGMLVVGSIWFDEFQSVATFLGLLSAGIAIALKDPLMNLAGWLFIIWRKPFVVGDRIQLGKSKGDVIDVRMLQFSIIEIGNWVDADQSTGRVIHIPNGRLFLEEMANYSEGFNFIWNELKVQVTFESNWRKAKGILQEVTDKHAADFVKPAQRQIKTAAEKFLIYYKKLTPIVYTTVNEFGVVLTIRYMCEIRARRGTEEKIWEDVLDRFNASDDIAFGYPTRRNFDHSSEGKPSLRPDQKFK